MDVWVTALSGLSAIGRNLSEMSQTLWEDQYIPPQIPKRLLKVASMIAGLTIGAEQLQPAFCVADDIFQEFRHSARDTLVLAEVVADELLKQAQIGHKISGVKTGVVLGSTAGNALHFLNDYAALIKKQPLNGREFKDFFDCNLAESLASKYDITGPVLTVGNACCSGTDAIGLGAELISSGRADRILAGGADALSLIPYIGFRRLMIYADEPCRPFDRRRTGLTLGEGAAMMLLESPEAAQKRGAWPLAKITGYASSADAYHLTAPHPQALGLCRAIKLALKRATISADDLAFVNAHGTGTPDNDRTESLAIRMETPGVPVWALKGSTGHTLGAAGALEAVLTVVALNKKFIPKSQGFEETDPVLGLKLSEPKPITKQFAMSISLGFGGGNSALIFKLVQ